MSIVAVLVVFSGLVLFDTSPVDEVVAYVMDARVSKQSQATIGHPQWLPAHSPRIILVHGTTNLSAPSGSLQTFLYSTECKNGKLQSQAIQEPLKALFEMFGLQMVAKPFASKSYPTYDVPAGAMFEFNGTTFPLTCDSVGCPYELAKLGSMARHEPCVDALDTSGSLASFKIDRGFLSTGSPVGVSWKNFRHSTCPGKPYCQPKEISTLVGLSYLAIVSNPDRIVSSGSTYFGAKEGLLVLIVDTPPASGGSMDCSAANHYEWFFDSTKLDCEPGRLPYPVVPEGKFFTSVSASTFCPETSYPP